MDTFKQIFESKMNQCKNKDKAKTISLNTNIVNLSLLPEYSRIFINSLNIV